MRSAPGMSRRLLLGASLTAAGAAVTGSRDAAAAASGPLPQTGTFVITLGTAAGPAVRGPRRGIATALLVDGDLYVVDCGLEIVRQLRTMQLPLNRLRAVFLTHLHSDHIIELPGLLLYNWGPQVNGFTEPFAIVGPGSARALPHGYPVVTGSPPTPGTEQVVNSILDGHAYDINIRVTDEGRPRLPDLARARDIELPGDVPATARGDLAPPMEPFEVYRDDKVRVLATLVHHPPVFPAYGFRFETPDGTVVFSGDTTEHDNTVRLAQDAQLLLHESVYLDYYRRQGFNDEFIHHLASSHTDPAGVGRVAAAAGVRHVVFQHLAGLATDAEWAEPARQSFGGRISVAHELDVLTP